MAQDNPSDGAYPMAGRLSMKRTLIPLAAFLIGSSLIAAVYLVFLTAVQDWHYALYQFSRDRLYVVPILVAFGVQSALYSILRFRLFVPVQSAGPGGAMMGASGSTSTAAMIACCLHHVTNVLPILGLSAATAFLARYQRPFMLVGLVMNILGVLVMLLILYRARQSLYPVLETI